MAWCYKVTLDLPTQENRIPFMERILCKVSNHIAAVSLVNHTLNMDAPLSAPGYAYYDHDPFHTLLLLFDFAPIANPKILVSFIDKVLAKRLAD